MTLWRLWILASGSLLAACATTPITVSPTSTTIAPPSSGGAIVVPRSGDLGKASVQPVTGDSGRCAVYLAEVRDTRPDTSSLGMMGRRAVLASDSVAWLRSALDVLKQDRRLRFVDGEKDAVFVLRVELVKAYIMAITTQKSSSVVLRVSYSRDGKDLDPQILRGRDTGGNWAFGEEETQGSLNRALSAAVSELDNDIVAHCHDAEK